MRSILAKMLRKEFKAQVIGKYSFLRETKEILIPAGCRIYQKKFEKDLMFFVILLISPKDDSYTLEFGWNTVNEIPNLVFLDRDKNTDEIINDLIVKDQANIRIGKLSNPKCQYDKWYVIGSDWTKVSYTNLFEVEEISIEESQKKLQESLVDVMNNFDKYILPCFERVAARHGYKLVESI